MTLVAQAGTAVDESISRAELANRLSRREMLGALAKSQRDVADALKHLGGAGARAPEEAKEPAANATSWSSDPISVSAASIERGMSAARSSITAAIEAAAGTVSEAAKLARPSAPKSGERAAGPTE